MHVYFGLAFEGSLYFSNGFDELVEGEIVIVLEVQMLELALLLALSYGLTETVLVFVLADVPYDVGGGADVL